MISRLKYHRSSRSKTYLSLPSVIILTLGGDSPLLKRERKEERNIDPSIGHLPHAAQPGIELSSRWREDGGNIGGSGVHFPSTPGKYPADLRSRANSQQYSSIYEDQRPKIEDIERSDGETTKPGVLKRLELDRVKHINVSSRPVSTGE